MSTIPVSVTLPLNLGSNVVSTVANDEGLDSISSNGLTLTSGLKTSIGLGFSPFDATTLLSKINALEYDGSAATATTALFSNVHLVQGETLTVNFTYTPGDTTYNDFAWSAIGLGTSDLNVSLMTDVVTANAYPNTSFSQTTTVYQTGNYNLLFGSSDNQDAFQHSTLTITSITLTIPSTIVTETGVGLKLDDGSQILSNGNVVLASGAVTSDAISNGGKALISLADSDAGLIGENSSGLINQDGNGVVSNDGGSLISQDGNGLIGEKGSGIVPTGASSFTPSYSIQSLDDQAATNNARPLSAPAKKIGTEIAIGETEPDSTQEINPSVAALSTGQFVVVWSDNNTASGSFEVRAQVLNADGSKAGASFLVSTFTGSDQTVPTVAALANGEFAVTWRGQITDAMGNQTEPDVHTQIFNTTGSKIGSEIEVGSLGASSLGTDEAGGSTASLSSGGFVTVVVASNPNNATGDTAFATIYTANGTPAGSGVSLIGSTAATATKNGTVVTGLQNGGFAVAYEEINSAATSDPDGVYLDIFGADGSRLKSEILANTTTAGAQEFPAIATLKNGNIVVTWVDEGSVQSNDLVQIRAQLFDPSGNKLGNEIDVATTSTTYSDAPAITALSDGRFAITYDAPTVSNGSVTGFNPMSVIFTADGTASATPFAVNPVSTTGVTETAPASVQLANGTLAFAGESNDGTTSSIRANLFNIGDAATPTEKTVSAPQYAPKPILDLANVDWVGSSAIGSPQIAALQNGNFVIVAPIRDQEIQFQLIDSFGEPIGSVISITGASLSESSQYANPYTTVTTLADGRFLIAWVDNNSATYNTLGEIFNADGSVSVPQFTLTAPFASGTQHVYAITALPDGGFEAVFTTLSTGGPEITIAQAYKSDGSLNGVPVSISLSPAGANLDSFATTLANGSVAIASSVVYFPVFGVVQGSVEKIETQVISASGVTSAVTISDPSPVIGAGIISNLAPQIAALKDGDYVVAWERIAGSSYSIQGVIMASDGVTEHGSFLYPITSNDQNAPIALTALADGGFVLGFSNIVSFGPSVSSTIGQEFNADGSLHGSPFNLALDPGYGPSYSNIALATGSTGRLAAVSNDSYGEAYIDAFTPDDVAAPVLPASATGTGATIAAELDSLQTLAVAGQISAVTFTDTVTPILNLTMAQLKADAAAISLFSGPYIVSLTDGAGTAAGTHYTYTPPSAPYKTFEYDYSPNNNFTGSKFFYGATASASPEEIDYDGGNHLARVAYTNVTGLAYSAYEYDYTGGIFAGATYTVTLVPAGATYSSYELDYDNANQFTGDKFFFTNVTSQPYTSEELDFDTNAKLSKVILGGVSGQAYGSIEEDYSAGVYQGYKAFYTPTGQSFTTEEVDVSVANAITKVAYTGLTNTPYSSVEQTYLNGVVTGSVYDFTNVAGATFSAYQTIEDASGNALQEIVDNNDGTHTIVGYQANQTFMSIGDDTMTGNATGDTFVFNPIFGHDTITDFASHLIGAGHDTISFSTNEFANFAAMYAATSDSALGATISATDGDLVTLAGVTKAQISANASDFKFS